MFLIKTILEAFGIPSSSDAHIVRDATGQYEIAYNNSYTFSVETLYYDIITYLYLRGEKASNRKVCFLISTISEGNDNNAKITVLNNNCHMAVMVTYKDVDANAVGKFLQAPNDNNLSSLSGISGFGRHNIYKSICCLLMTADTKSPHVNTVIIILQKLYKQIRITLQPVVLPNNNNLIFAEYILQLFDKDKITQLDIKNTQLKFHNACELAVKAYLNNLSQRNELAHKKIYRLLNIILKHSFLIERRNGISINNLNSIQLESILAQDLIYKRLAYSSPIHDVTQYLKDLPLFHLLNILSYEDISLVIKYLKETTNDNVAKIRKWEEKVKNMSSKQGTYPTLLLTVSRKASLKIYQNSLIGLGGEIGKYLGEIVPVNTVSTVYLVAGIQCVTQNRFRKEHVPFFTQLLGVLFSIAFMYLSGSYFLFKSILLAFVIGWLKDMAELVKVNDKKASLMPYNNVLLQVLANRYGPRIILAAIETIASGKKEQVVHALGGMAFSEVMNLLIRQFIVVENNVADISSSKLLVLIFASLITYELGSKLTSYVVQGLDKLISSDEIKNEMCEIFENKSNRIGCHVDFTGHSIWSPRFWVSKSDTIHMGWRQADNDYEADCNVIHISDDNRYIDCTEPAVIQKRLK